MARRRSLFRVVRELPFVLGLPGLSTPLLWSKGIGDHCDYAGPRWYRLAQTENTQPESFFAEHYRQAHGLVWVRLGTVSRHGVTCDLDSFVTAALPSIAKPFILITTDGDVSVPSELRPETVAALKANRFLLGWYSQNFDGSDPDIKPFPIGLDFHFPRKWITPRRLAAFLDRLGAEAPPARARPLRIFCDLNLSPTDARHEAIDALRGCNHVDIAEKRVSQTAIWRRYTRYPLVLSAHGNGLDCHRTWELLLLGCIVVTKTSSLDPLYDGLPVVILDNWRQARDPSRLARWVEDYSPLTGIDRIRSRLTTEAWIAPLRGKLSDRRRTD